MKEKIKIPLENLIFKKENIIDLAEYILKQEKEKSTFMFRIKFTNNQEIESDDISVFKNRKFEEYEIDFIRMNYSNYERKDDIDVYIYNGDDVRMSCIEITSFNSEWFALTEKEVKELLTYCDKQSKISFIFRKFSLECIIVLLMSCFTTFLVGCFINKIFINMEKNVFTVLLIIVFNVVIFLNIHSFEELEKAFPSIEISILEKNNKSGKKRAQIFWIISSLVLPLLLNAIYDILKSLV